MMRVQDQGLGLGPFCFSALRRAAERSPPAATWAAVCWPSSSASASRSTRPCRYRGAQRSKPSEASSAERSPIVLASATKQPRDTPRPEIARRPGLLRCARKDGDGVMGAICAAQGTGPPAHDRPPPSREMPRQRHADPLDGDARLAGPATTRGRRALRGGLLRGLLRSRLRMTGMARSSAGQDQASACYTVQQRGPAR